MIASLTGRVVDKTPSGVVLDVSGVGFAVAISTHTLASLPAQGDTVTLLTHLHVREDDLSLFGFRTAEERSLFGHLITVSGVGPKVALAALSSMQPDELCEAIAAEDVALVSGVPGIGAKTAQRICLELKDKVNRGATSPGPRSGGRAVPGETRDALLAMGFSAAEVSSAMKGFDGPADDTQAHLRYALKRLGGGA